MVEEMASRVYPDPGQRLFRQECLRRSLGLKATPTFVGKVARGKVAAVYRSGDLLEESVETGRVPCCQDGSGGKKEPAQRCSAACWSRFQQHGAGRPLHQPVDPCRKHMPALHGVGAEVTSR